MDISSSINFQKLIQEICTFFVRVFKDDEIPDLPEFELLYSSCPDDSRLKVISFLISVAIDVFACQPDKFVKSLIGDKIGLWRTLVVRICHNHCADKHHLPFEIDIIASKNKLIVESLIFDWPFCNEGVSQLLQYLCEAFHGSNHVNQPYIDEFVSKYKPKYRRAEAMKCLVLAIKWVHTVQCSPNYEKTKDVLKQSILNVALVSEVIMKNREGQFDEIWNEIISQLDNYNEFDSSRIDSYPFYCQINPILKNVSDLVRYLFSEENYTDFSRILSSFHELSERYENHDIWGLDLTNTILAALNTIMIEMIFRRCKTFPKICENNLKMFINQVAVNEPISQLLLMSEVNYWVDRMKRKRIDVQINLSDYFSGQWLIVTSETMFITNLEDYFQKVLTNESGKSEIPILNGSFSCITETKQFQKVIINSLKSTLNNINNSDPYFPPISEAKMKLLMKIVEKIAEYYEIKLQTNFCGKIYRIIEKFNSLIFKKKDIYEEIDNKNMIIPLLDNIDYKKFVSDIWKCVNLNNSFLKPINIQKHLFDIRHELFSQPISDQADRIISRIMFYTGWRFRLRPIDVSSSELFKFHMVFNFLSQNLPKKTWVDKNLSFWMRKLMNIEYSKSISKNLDSSVFQMDEFFVASKLDSVKFHVIQVLRGAKNISIPQLSDISFPLHKKGLESTKAILQILRTVFGSLNSPNRHKHDNPKTWLSHTKALETDLHIICSKLDADGNQVLAELDYLFDFITKSLGEDYLEKFMQEKESIILDADNSDEENYRSSHRRRSSIKIEKLSIEKDQSNVDSKQKFNQSTKRKLKEKDSDEMMALKLPRISHFEIDDKDDDNDDDYDDDFSSKSESRLKEKTSLQSKVNFISSSSDLSIGAIIESRITYINEPTLRSICIDPGKGKSRPPKYIQISACPNRIPMSILKKPKLCSNRQKSKSINETKSLYNFNIIREVGMGSFGKIFEAVDKFSNLRVALKRITLNNAEDGIPQSILREIFLYKSMSHSNVIQFVNIVVDEIVSIKSKFSDLEVIVPKSFYFVFEYVEHDLYGLLKSNSMVFSMTQVGFLSKQLFSALAYIHEKNIVHRDITPSNLMISNRGILKLADFGNARLLIKDVQLDNNLALTPKMVPFFYRAPEILMEMENYGTEVDIWSAGCVIYEILTSNKLWVDEKEDTEENNEDILKHLENIAKILGSPNASVWPSVAQSKYFLDLATRGVAINYSRKIEEHMKQIPYDAADVLKQIFQWDASKRITAKCALNSDWLQHVEMRDMMPSEFPDRDCHDFLSKNPDKPLTLDNQQNQAELPLEENMNALYNSNRVANGNESIVNNNVTQMDMANKEEEIKDEDLLRFVDSLSGRILALGDVLDRMRSEPVCTPDIVKGVIMRAARVWSETEAIRLKMVVFMQDYLLKPDEKEKLGFV